MRSAEQPADLLPYTLEVDDSGVAPPHKWDVYEQILQVPYYLVFSRYTNRLRFFKLTDGRYQEQELGSETPMAWLPELDIGLGIWHGEFEGVSRAWLRWCDDSGHWLLTDTEQAEQRAERLAAYLRAQGLDPDDLPELSTWLSLSPHRDSPFQITS